MTKSKTASAFMKGCPSDPHCRLPGHYRVSAPALMCTFDIPEARNGWDALDQAKGCNKGETDCFSQLDLRGRTRGWTVTKVE
jgi:hypothetical protein